MRVTFAAVRHTGRYAASRAYRINVDGLEIGRIQECTNRKDQWFWYAGRKGLSKNTAAQDWYMPLTDAKKTATEWVKLTEKWSSQ
jgi:hypothetical protein